MTDFIYGVGNEVLTVAILVLVGFLPLIWFTIRRTDLRELAHPWFLPEETFDPSPSSDSNAEGMANRMENVEPGAHALPSRVYNPERCPICLNEHQLALETNCGHMYCGNCLRVYIYMGGLMTRINCPMCRQPITVLFTCFTVQERAAPRTSTLGEEVQVLYVMVEQYNHCFSGSPRSFLEIVRDWPTLMRHLWNEFFSIGGLMLMFRIRIVLCFMAALMYLFSPLDIIPEAVFGVLGLLDDIFVVFLLAIYISIIYRRLVVSRTMTT